MSPQTSEYHCLKPEVVLLAHKDPYTWNKKIFKKFENLNFIQKLLKLALSQTPQLWLNQITKDN